MTEEAQERRRRPSKLWMIPAALAVIVSILVIPPLVNINRYKGQITRLMAASLRRPVRLSAVELRLLPRPGFVLTDLTVEEDPSYGVEPVLHANTVTASIRFLPLWRGRLEISRVSVDEASLNLVRTTEGRWNLDSVFRTAAQSQSDPAIQHKDPPLPYLEATNSRINIKQGFEKLPFSLLNADLSFWQEKPGDWRVRLRGQPARTDVSLDLGDTGILQLEASMRRAPELRQMPLHLDVEWRQAQLGQLSKLVLGSDPGWRGNLTGEMQMDGTADAAKVTTRLRAAGVHRAEFAPAAPLDFDANCNFVYHYSERNLENLVCDSPLGDGHLRVEGNLPANAQAKMSLELQRIPAQAVLDALRTVRNEVGAGLEADGTLSGKLTYDPGVVSIAPKPIPPSHRHAAVAPVSRPAVSRASPPAIKAPLKEQAIIEGPLSGSITVDNLRLSGNSLTKPIQIQKIAFEPVPSVEGEGEVLGSTVNLPAGGATPLVFTANLNLSGYKLTIRGPGTPVRVKELARAAGLPDAAALDAIAGDPVTLDLAIEGPWLPAPDASVPNSPALSTADRLTGTVTLHNANWKADALATAVQVSEATLHLGEKDLRWDPVDFSYGSIKGTASLQIPPACEAPVECPPTLNLQFTSLDTAELQSTLLGAKKQGTLLSNVIARFTSSSAPVLPKFDGTVKADSLIVGPVQLENAVIAVHVTPMAVEFTSLDAGLLEGQIHAAGKMTSSDKPDYSFEAEFQKLRPSLVCELLAQECAGVSIDGNGKVELAGFTGKDLASSAKGTVHFDWKRGTFPSHTSSSEAPNPPALSRFDSWTADAEIADGAVKLKKNTIQQGSRKSAIEAAVIFGEPPKVTFTAPKPTTLSKR